MPDARVRFVNASVWFGAQARPRPATGQDDSIDSIAAGEFDQALLELLTVLRGLPRTGPQQRYALRLTVTRVFADGTFDCTAGVEFATLAALVVFAAARALDPLTTVVLDAKGNEVAHWRYASRGRTHWKEPSSVVEQEGVADAGDRAEGWR